MSRSGDPSQLIDLAPSVVLAVDEYREARGGDSTLLLLSCSACAAELCLYQKDGPGPLLRCYLNRIHPDDGVWNRLISEDRKFTCAACGARIGVATTYEDGRSAVAVDGGSLLSTTLRFEQRPSDRD